MCYNAESGGSRSNCVGLSRQ